MPNVQFSVTAQRSGARRSDGSGGFGFGDTEIALKVRFIQESRTLPQVAFYPSVTLPSGDGERGLGEGGTTVFLPVWAQKDIGVWTAFGGGGVDHRSIPGSKNSSFAGIAAQRDISERDSYGFELYHTTSDHPGGTDTTSAGFGFIHRVGGLHAVLFSVGRALHGDNGFTGYAAYEFNLGPKPRAGAAAEQH